MDGGGMESIGIVSRGRATGNVSGSTPFACARGSGPLSRFPPPPPPPCSTRGGATNTIRDAGRTPGASVSDEVDRGAGNATSKVPIAACTRSAVISRPGADIDTPGIRGDGRSNASSTRSPESRPLMQSVGRNHNATRHIRNDRVGACIWPSGGAGSTRNHPPSRKNPHDGALEGGVRSCGGAKVT